MRELVKRLVARVLHPAVVGVESRLEENTRAVLAVQEMLGRWVDRAAPSEWTRARAGGHEQRKYEEELGYWRWAFKSEEGRRSFGGRPEAVFTGWQRDRLRQLARWLELAAEDAPTAALDSALDAWCEGQRVVEVGSGPWPAVSTVPRWRSAVAVDPLVCGYAENSLLPEAAPGVVYVEAPGERIPLPSGRADLVVLENMLDHVADPPAVLDEALRLLRPGGLLWFLVDLSTYRDAMHPHPFSETTIRDLLRNTGFEALREDVTDHKSHPEAYGEYRGLLRKAA